jgi:hypothetical protein
MVVRARPARVPRFAGFALKRSATIPPCAENLNPDKVVMKPNKNRVRFCRNLAHDAPQHDAEKVVRKICLHIGRDEQKGRTMTRAKTKILFDGGALPERVS